MRRSEKEKADLIKKWKKSGKSRTAWCKEQGISIITLNRWIEAQNASKNNRTSNEPVFAKAEVDFSDYRETGDRSVDSGEPAYRSAEQAVIRVRAAGRVLEIYCATEKTALRNVLEAVAECL